MSVYENFVELYASSSIYTGWPERLEIIHHLGLSLHAIFEMTVSKLHNNRVYSRL